MKKIVFILLPVFIIKLSIAQVCKYFPADCPDASIEATKDSDACIRNWIIPQEISMQNRLRPLFTSMIESVASKKGWEVYEFTETNSGGITIDATKPVAYELRPPFHFSMTFDFVVNNDSLVAWQNWYNNDLRSKAEDVVNSYKQTDNSSGQPLVDSSMYYVNQMTKYMNDHSAEYQKALLSNDAKYQKKYNEDVAKYQKKIDQFVNKANAKRDENFSTADTKGDDLQAYKKRKTIAFRNASTLRVSIQVNEYTTATLPETTKAVKPLTVTSSSFASLFHNSDRDQNALWDSFQQNPDFAIILFGKWNTTLNQYKQYDANYRSDRQEMKEGLPKTTMCDRIQTIAVVAEGKPQSINFFLQSFDWSKLNALIEK